ncbi:hypothetical protein J4468_01155 [Candidatus Woesearchaeota archaeon]|nr:hypothetical protein [Candidatus Woesearchaeota archaeon]
MEPLRVWPYKPSKIGEAKHGKFAVAGVIVDKQGDLTLIDDGLAKISVLLEHNLAIGCFVRAFGRVTDGEMQGDLIQDINKIDKFLYAKTLKLIHE